ncbi:zinc transport system substrate-binding protein [Pseudobutyrivibrio sp. ACV-2]|uniref:metal ABC transporter substrate-binding protein n=1 Tax=Pseudobutyrivibrio sp. ACV-2 TaxID=1520801 RepID=UPI0008982358|nr:metal ABC transporter substrate-binding protein [Pseudobutyrivibrio sp. ACV-2]SEA22515.1 zinc transport system substrate-binding protein [Pseudobutyrivibrio sp. ACV-2]
MLRKTKYLFVLLLLISISVVCTCGTFFYVKLNNNAAASDDLLIMTSCNPVYIATLNVVDGIDGITVQNLSQPTTGCLHDYTLTTEDMKNLSKADVLVVNGGGMEGYLEDVIAAYPKLPIIDTYEYVEHSPGFDALLLAGEEGDHEHEEADEEHHEESEEEHHHHDHGENSHLWMNEILYNTQAAGIVNGLVEADLGIDENVLLSNLKSYGEKLETIDKQGLDNKLKGQNVAVLHAAFAYTAQSIGANVVATMDLDEERQVSAGEVSEFLDVIRDNDVKIVFAEYDYGNAMGKLIEEQTDAKVVYLETLVHGSYSADDYVKVINENYSKINNTL